jgi:hypothetical protein
MGSGDIQPITRASGLIAGDLWLQIPQEYIGRPIKMKVECKNVNGEWETVYEETKNPPTDPVQQL